MVKIFSIEGNIGSGKSTLVNILKEAYQTSNDKIVFMQEPVDEWLKIKDNYNETILSKFYKNQHKYGFSFQMMAYISRISALKKLVKENPDAIIICERCVLTDRHVFAKMLYDEGKIEHVNYMIYLQWFDEFLHDIPIDGLIYVQADPEKSYARVMKRQREGEIIPLEYLRNCHLYHESWILKENVDVLILDANRDYEPTTDDYKKWIYIIQNFIQYKSNETVHSDNKTITKASQFSKHMKLQSKFMETGTDTDTDGDAETTNETTIVKVPSFEEMKDTLYN